MRAESTSNCSGRFGGSEARSGASSSTTWALVPPAPNELTPARRGVGPSGHGRSCAFTTKGVCESSSLGFGDW